MHSLEPPNCEKLIIGAKGFSDASVYRLDDGTLLVQSLDFFPPLVDDPHTFGQIAAANSLSDVYAMGASPVTALNIVAFPDDRLALEILTEILRGGDSKVREAGAVTAGGHTVRDKEIKYGLSVTGLCTPENLLHNSNAQPGGLLILTKPLGTGFITTAMKSGKASARSERQAIQAMTTLNNVSAFAARRHNASSMTDITGFGLAGHATELANGSDVTLHIKLASLPILDNAINYYQSGHITRASKSNRQANDTQIHGLAACDSSNVELLFDPQTSGGLLISIPESNASAFIVEVSDKQPFCPVVIGEVKPRTDNVSLLI